MTLLDTEEFFKKVFWDKAFFGFITSNKIRVMNEPYRNRNQVFKLWAERWHVKNGFPGKETVLPHFESHVPGVLHIHVEVDPYEGSTGRAPAKIEYLQPLLELKSRIQADIRETVTASELWVSKYGATSSGLGNCEKHGTLSAVKFEADDVNSISAERCAEFYVNVMRDLIPLIESRIAQYA